MTEQSDAMKRRLTSTDNHLDLGGLGGFSEPMGSPTSAWSSFNGVVFWRQPTRWQLYAPRLRSVAKLAFSLMLLITFYTIYLLKPSSIGEFRGIRTDDGTNHGDPQQDWIWKDFEVHDGLIRGMKDFEVCDENGHCEYKAPHIIRYEGTRLRHQKAQDMVACIGPRGLALNTSDADAVWAYQGTTKGAVDSSIGSYAASGLDGSISFDRLGRFQAYGIHQFDSGDNSNPFDDVDVEWDSILWGDLQRACIGLNKDRFEFHNAAPKLDSMHISEFHHQESNLANSKSNHELVPKIKRTAILIRVWTGAMWSADAVLNIRAMIVEASLSSGGEFQVFILLHVKDESIPLFAGENQPWSTIEKFVPPEFRSITEVWNDAQIRSLYSNIVEHAYVSRSPWMAIQYFARNHPEFDFFYQWEFDVRYTGHYLDLFEAISQFGRNQPRKGAWERAGRHYIPKIHGRFEDNFRYSVKEDDPHHVWGPVAAEGVKPRGPKPPRKQKDDNYEWGVGEDADWIGFLPSFNVSETNWWFKDYLWGYAQGTSLPRRATLIAQGRVSRRALEIMNYENTENGHHMDAEMFPQTVCLHHGLKSTSFPHPIFADRHWPLETLQSVFNGGPHGQAGGFLKSTFSKWNEDAWTNFTWYYSSAQAKPIYQNFLGIATASGGGSEWEAAHGRAVIRPMLLHPVKGAKSLHWTSEGWKQTRGGR